MQPLGKLATCISLSNFMLGSSSPVQSIGTKKMVAIEGTKQPKKITPFFLVRSCCQAPCLRLYSQPSFPSFPSTPVQVMRQANVGAEWGASCIAAAVKLALS